jgi:cell division septum initiation protein DivIVA
VVSERAHDANFITGRLTPSGPAHPFAVLEQRLAQIQQQLTVLLDRAESGASAAMEETTHTVQLAKRAGDAILADARAEAEELLGGARTERQELVRSAREEIAAELARSDERQRALDAALAAVGAQLAEHRAFLAQVDHQLEAMEPIDGLSSLSPPPAPDEERLQNERRSLFGR